MGTFPFHTSHALQPLNVHCFKPFKTIFKKEKGNAMVRNNHFKLSKQALASWVDKALNQILSKKNTMS
jgi:hypothetical protein